MKKSLFSLVLGLAVLLCSAGANAQDWKKLDGEKSTIETNINLRSSSESEMLLEFDFNAYALEPVTTSKGASNLINIPGCSRTKVKGAPDLPKISQAVMIPDMADMTLEVIKSRYIEIEGVDLAPSKGVITRDKDPASIPYEYGEVYSKDAFYPSNLANANDPYIIRNVRGQSIIAYPVQYNPVSKTLRIYTKMTVKLTASGKKGVNPLKENMAVKNDAVFNKVLTNHFINYKPSSSKYTPISEDGKKMLIVAYSSYVDEMEAFKSWKESIGYTVNLVDYSTIGSSSALKTYIQNQYDQNGISYVILAGDHAQVPSSSTSAGYSDNNYGYTSGNDHYLDLFVGRFSAETSAQLQTQIDRTIYYERDVSSSASFFQKGVGIASNEGTGGGGDDNESDEQHMNNIEYDLEGYGYTIDRVYQDGGSASQLTSALNNGRGIINYVGHGSNTSWSSMYYSQSVVNGLTNDNKLPFVISVACVVGNFTSQTCFAETWLRATNNGNPTGAIVFCGSTINQSWASPMCAQDEMNDLLVSNSYINYGGMFVNGMFQMIDEYGSDGENMADTWTVFGDPSVQMRTPGHPDGPNGGVVNPPVADFTASSTTIQEGEAVTFTSTSTNNPTDYSWTFEGGDPSTSTASSPSVSYATAGTYDVSLAVSNSAGSDSESKTNFITVEEYVPSYCASAGQDASYEWISKVEIGSFSYSSGSDGGYADYTGQTITLGAGNTVNVNLTPGFGSSTYEEYWKIWIDYNNDKDFDDSGELVFSGNGSSAVSGSFTVNSGATGTTRMRVTMKYNGAPTACESFDYGEVEDYTVTFGTTPVDPPVADFSASATTISVGETVSFTDLSTNDPTAWNWAFEGGDPSSSTAQNPSVSYNTAGTYEVSLTATNEGGEDTETKSAYITVEEQVAEYCSSNGQNVDYEWIAGVEIGAFSNTSSADGGYADFTAQTANLAAGATVNVTLTPGFASSSYAEYWKIWIDYNNDKDFNDPGEEVFSGNGSSTVSGSFTVASSASGTTRMRVTMKYNGEPTTCESFSYGEVEDYTVTFGGVAAPTAAFTASATTITVGESVSFTDQSSGSPTSWSWAFEGGDPSSSTAQNPGVTYNTAGTYQVALTVSNDGGSDTETKSGYITVEDGSNPVEYCSSSGNNSSYEWIESLSFGTFTNTSGDNGGYADFTNQTVYMTPGGSVDITLTPGFSGSSYSEYWVIWIDYNKDGDFDDANEQFASGNGSGELSGTVNADAAGSGTTRMRVSMKYNAAPTACETFSYGEVEDYTVSFTSKGAREAETMELSDVKVYPQPAQEYLYIEVPDAGATASIKIYNMSGQLVKAVQAENNGNRFELDIADQNAGIYSLQIVSEGKIFSKRIMLQ